MKRNYELELASMFEKKATKELTIEEMEQSFLSQPIVKAKVASSLPIESVDLADKWGRDLAKEITKEALGFPIGAGARQVAGVMGGARRMMGTGLNYASHASTMQRMGVGAAIGGVMGGMRNPGLDPQTGMPRSRMGGMMGGAAMGGLAGYAAKPAAQSLMGAEGRVGQMAQAASKRGKMPGGAATSPKGNAPGLSAAAPANPGGVAANYQSGAAGYDPAGAMQMQRVQQGYASLGNVNQHQSAIRRISNKLMPGGAKPSKAVPAAAPAPKPVAAAPVPQASMQPAGLTQPQPMAKPPTNKAKLDTSISDAKADKQRKAPKPAYETVSAPAAWYVQRQG